ncbi:MAG: hypothetical protein GY941_19875 [Planctomycetes bacterium]|nr:hypothetical protein [Planctomycetota bacterium]
MSFDKFAECLFDDLEGPDSDSPIDPGKLTVWGFAYSTRQRLGLPNRLTREAAAAALSAYYWLPLGCNKMQPAIAWLVCDIHFNHIPKTATLVIQKALGNVRVDGIYGAKTMKACANVASVKNFIKRYAYARRKHYAYRSGDLIERYALSKEEEKLSLAIQQEHGWQNRPDKLFACMWEAGLLKREPSLTEEVTKTTVAATVAAGAATLITAAVPEGGTVLDVAKHVGTMAMEGNLTVSSVAAYGVGFAYNKYLKGKNLTPKFMRGWFK